MWTSAQGGAEEQREWCGTPWEGRGSSGTSRSEPRRPEVPSAPAAGVALRDALPVRDRDDRADRAVQVSADARADLRCAEPGRVGRAVVELQLRVALGGDPLAVVLDLVL